jgi:Signal peptidase I
LIGEIKKYLAVLGIILIASFLSSCLGSVRVEGNAMMPTLADGDRLFIERNFGELKRGDIVMFLYPKDRTKSYIKESSLRKSAGDSIFRDGR